MATLLGTWYTPYVRSGTTTTSSTGDCRGMVMAYLESQGTAVQNTSYIRLDYYLRAYTSTKELNISASLNFRANQGSYGGTLTGFGFARIVYSGGGYENILWGSKYFTVTHNLNGTGTLYVDGNITVTQFYLDGASNWTGSKNLAAATVELPTINRYATISSVTRSATSTSTMSVSWSGSPTIDLVQYSLDLGAWVNAQTGDRTSGTFTISGLAAGTTYAVRIRVRRKDTQYYTTSGSSNVTTLYNPSNIMVFTTTPNPLKEKATVTLGWSGATTPQGTIDYYDIYSRHYNGSTWTNYAWLNTVWGTSTTHTPLNSYATLKHGDIIQYQVYTHNTSGGWSPGVECTPTLTISLDSTADIRIAGVYRNAKPWIRISGVWRKGRFWRNVAGVWKLGK